MEYIRNQTHNAIETECLFACEVSQIVLSFSPRHSRPRQGLQAFSVATSVGSWESVFASNGLTLSAYDKILGALAQWETIVWCPDNLKHSGN